MRRVRVAGDRVTLSANILVLFIACLGWAQQAGLQSYEVKYQGQAVTIRVSRNTPLSELLEALCQAANSRCEGVETASKLVTVPMSVTGPWEKVVASLLEGTQLNYSSIAPSSSRPGSLIIQGYASQISNPIDIPQPVETGAMQDSVSSTSILNTSSSNGSNVTNEGTTVATSPTFPSTSGAADTSFASAAVSGVTDLYRLPVAISSGPAIEAMPDRAGNPIPVDLGGGPLIEPMHEKNGRSIPVVIESQSYEPMPDKSGNLIPVNVARRH